MLVLLTGYSWKDALAPELVLTRSELRISDPSSGNGAVLKKEESAFLLIEGMITYAEQWELSEQQDRYRLELLRQIYQETTKMLVAMEYVNKTNQDRWERLYLKSYGRLHQAERILKKLDQFRSELRNQEMIKESA